MRIGYFLSSEEYTPAELIEQARLAERAGFEALWISDHYHPWVDAQGQSSFVWSMIGALSQATGLPVTSAVTCPIMRVHPAVIAQAAATSQVLLNGRFALGVGTGELLNEHVTGERWPGAGERLERLEEAVEVIRRLWTGRQISHRGRHFTVTNARVYTLPDEPPPIYLSGFGPKSISLAARLADGFISVIPSPDSIRRFREAGGAGKVVQGGYKVAYGPDRDEALRVAHRRWPIEALPGELNQTLATPTQFEQAATLVTPAMIADKIACGPDPEVHIQAMRRFVDAGFDEAYVSQTGGHFEEFFSFYGNQILPAVR